MGLRFPITAALASLVTFGLFWVMQALVSVPYTLGKSGAPPSINRRTTSLWPRCAAAISAVPS